MYKEHFVVYHLYYQYFSFDTINYTWHPSACQSLYDTHNILEINWAAKLVMKELRFFSFGKDTIHPLHQLGATLLAI
jgi:hypothetical protein